MGTLSVAINSVPVQVKEGSFQEDDSINAVSTLAFKVRDDAGTSHFSKGQPVSVTDSVTGLSYTGFVSAAIEDRVSPNTLIITDIGARDNHYLAEKRTYDGPEATNILAGAMFCLMLNTLNSEGITAKYAVRRDTTQTDFSAGTLTGVSATSNVTDGDLELTPAGANVTQTDNTTALFAAGTLSQVDAHNNQLNLKAYNVIKLNGTCAISGNNAFLYWKIWSGSQAIASGQTFQYDVWISSTSAAQQAAVDFVCTDGSTLRDFNSQGIVDQFGIKAHPSADLSGFATDQWYHRTIDVSALAGKTIAFVQLSFESDSVGNYQAYFRNIKYVDVGGVTVLITFYDSTVHPYDPQNATLNANSQVSNQGYSNVQVQQVTAYDQTGSRISPAISIDAVKVVNSSLVAWASVIPAGITPGSQSGNTPLVPAGTTLTISTSLDGQATFQPASFNAPISTLEAGFNVTGRSMYTQIQLAITGTTPEITPACSLLTTTVTTAYVAGTVNSLTTYDTTANFNTGTNVNTLNWAYVPDDSIPGTPNGNVTLTGMFFNFLGANGANGTANLQLWGTASPAKTNFKRQCKLTTGTGTDVKARFLSYGPAGSDSFQNFTAQVLVQVVALAVGNSGIVYRTTGWVNGNDTYAYYAGLTTNGPILYRATNGGASTSTLIANPAVTLTAGNWYTLKIIVNGSNHQVYIDDVLYINATDATYAATGNLGLRFYNNSGSTQSGLFENFGIVNALSGTWISPAVSLNALTTIGQSAVFWNSVVPNGGSLICESTINGGSTWQVVAQGGQIGNLPPGTSTVGISVQLRFTFTTLNASVTPVLQALSMWAVSQVTVSGNRITPVLSLAPVGRMGSNVLSWNANLPAGTTLGIDAGPDGTTWTDVSALNGQPLPASLMKTQPGPWFDAFGSITDWTDRDIGAVGLAGSASLTMPTWTIKGSGADIFSPPDAFHYDYQAVSGNSVLTTRVVTEQNTASAAKAGLMARQDTTTGSVYYHCFCEPAGTVNVEYRTVAGGSGSAITPITQAVPVYLKIANTGTSWSAYTSPDGITWTLIAGSTITMTNLTGPFLLGLTVCAHNNAVLNTSTFDSVTISGTGAQTDYLSTFLTGGAVAAWTWDTANKQLVGVQTSGIDGVLQYPGFMTYADMLVEADFNYSDDGAIVARMVDASNAYFLSVHDSAASSGSNTLVLRKIVAGVVSTIAGPTAINFIRGTYHRFRLDCQGTTIKSFMDGIQIHSVTDASVTAAGKAGLLAGQVAANKVQAQSLRVAPYGDDVTAKNLYTRQRLATTDPTVTPQVLDVTLCVFGNTIAAGVLVPQTNYYHNYIDKNNDDLAKRSGYWWYFDKNKAPYFLPSNAVPAPWVASDGGSPVTGIPQGDFMDANITVEDSSDLYRNRQIIENVLAPVTINETRKGDGVSTSWVFGNQWAGAPTILVGGVKATVGVKNVDTGKQFYYAVGDNTITEDASGPVYDLTATLNFSGPGQFLTYSQADNLTEQAALAAKEGTSGIVVMVEDGTGLTKAQGDALAQDRLNQYSVRGRLLKATTRRFGLAPGQLLSVFLPAHNITNGQFLIRQIHTTLTTEGPTGSMVQQPWYQIEASSSPADLGDWTKLYQRT